jgi:hypothetical protein
MSTDALRKALTPDRDAVIAALADAELELEHLRAREAELEELIRRARELLGIRPGDVVPGGGIVAPVGPMTLHEAMQHVLRTNGPMTSRQLADTINELGLYRQRQGGAAPAGQISARMKRYPNLFERGADGLIRLIGA